MAGPHRSQEYSELCGICRERSEDCCFRCGVPLCHKHEPAEHQRCEGCEGDFLAMTRMERRVIDAYNRGQTYTEARRPFVFAPFGVIALLVCFLSLPIAAGIAGAGLLATQLIPPTVPEAKLRHTVKRQRFLGAEKWRAKRLAAKRAKARNDKQLGSG
jgi:hypothetical protein